MLLTEGATTQEPIYYLASPPTMVAAAILQAALGIAAEILGLYIVMVAGTNLVPQFLRFTHWKWWMRAELGLWGAALLSGLGAYCVW